MRKVLVIDDDASYRAYLRRFLLRHRFEPLEAGDAARAWTLIRSSSPDLILLDWCLKEKSGLDLLRRLRHHPEIPRSPVVMISGVIESAEDETRALEAGADLFLEKSELSPHDLTREHSLLRHFNALILRGSRGRQCGNSSPGPVYLSGDLRLDMGNVDLTVGGKPVHLVPKEMDLLESFLRRPNVLHVPEALWDQVWGTPRHGPWIHTLTATISALRRKLGPEWSARLVNSKARGYRLVVD